MDAFYASVEQLDDPDLVGKCVIVGGTSNRGVVSAASYEARKLGVHSAMPVFMAKQKCPDGVYVHPRMHRYKEKSDQVMEILGEYSPLIEQVSIDEAYIDGAGLERLYGPPEKMAEEIKARVKSQTGLTCSIGVAPLRFLAKIASDLDKPDGLTFIAQDEMHNFISTLPVGKIPGVGKTMLRQLDILGIKTMADVANYPEQMVRKRLGKFGQRLLELAAGIDETPITTDYSRKSVSCERTLSKDTDDLDFLNKMLLAQAVDVARQLRKLERRAKTVTLKIKHSDFKSVTRSETLKKTVQSSESIYRECAALLAKYAQNNKLKSKVRLIGAGVSNLVTQAPPMQKSLFEDDTAKDETWETLDRTMDKITEKFGKDAIKPASVD